MPSPEEIIAQEQVKYNEFFNENDPFSLTNYLDEVLQKTDDPVSPELTGFANFVVEMARSNDPKKEQFLVDIMGHVGKRNAQLSLELGKKTDEVRQHVINQETEGLEVLSNESETDIDNMARAFASNQTEIGLMHGRNTVIGSLIREVFRNTFPELSDKLREKCVQAFAETGTQTWNEITQQYDAETRKRYKQATEPVDSDSGLKSSKSGVLKKNRLVIDVGKTDGFVFSKTDNIYQHMKAMNDLQLSDFAAELESDLEISKNYEKDLRDWGSKAAEFLKELQENSSEETKQTPAYAAMEKALSSNSSLDGERNFIDEEFLNRKFTDLRNAAEAFPDKNFTEKLLKAASKSEKILQNDLKNGVEDLIKKNTDFDYCDSSAIEEDLRRVRAEEAYREYKKDPAYQSVRKLNAKTKACADQQDEITGFKETVKKAIRYAERTTKDLATDKESRQDISNRNKHKDYYALTERTDELGKLDMDKMTPKQILEKMREAKAAADQYVGSHEGFFNITKGWSDEGKMRIAYANKISQTLDKQIKALEPTVEALSAKIGEGKTLETRNTELEVEKTSYRTQAAELRQKAMEKASQPPEIKIGTRIQQYQKEMDEHAQNRMAGKNGTILENAAYAAADSLQKLQRASEHEKSFTPEQQKNIMKHIGRVIAYDTRPFSENKDLSSKEYNRFVGNMGDNAHFQEALKQTMGDINPRNLKRFCADPHMTNQISKTFGLIRSNKSMEPLEKKPAVEKDQLQNESAPKELMQNL